MGDEIPLGVCDDICVYDPHSVVPFFCCGVCGASNEEGFKDRSGDLLRFDE
jgi:hypothetical protein